MKKKDPMPKGFAAFMAIIGLFMGSVLTFGMNYWNGQIEAEDAIRVEAAFDYYNERPARSGTGEISVYFKDHDQLSINVVCVNSKLRETLDKLPRGTKIYLLLHPNSDTILDMKTDSQTILDFDDVTKKLQVNNIGFLFLGIFMYICTIYSACCLVKSFIRKRK